MSRIKKKIRAEMHARRSLNPKKPSIPATTYLAARSEGRSSSSISRRGCRRLRGLVLRSDDGGTASGSESRFAGAGAGRTDGSTEVGTVSTREQRGQSNVVPARSSPRVSRVLHPGQMTTGIGFDLSL